MRHPALLITAAARHAARAALLLALWTCSATAGAVISKEREIARFEGLTSQTVETLSGTERRHVFDFNLPPDRYESLLLALHWEHAPLTNLKLELRDASGRIVGTSNFVNSSSQTVKLGAPAPGAYRAVVTESRSLEGQRFLLSAHATATQDGEPTECDAAYATGAAPTVVDTQLQYGAPGRLVLSFASDADRDAAALLLNAAPWLAPQPGAELHRFTQLPLLALRLAAITPEAIKHLQNSLAGTRLLGIYQDRPLSLLLDTSTAVIRAPTARSHYGVTGQGIGVAIIDSGVDQGQGDFANLVHNVKIDPATGTAIPLQNTDTTSGHGTHVASTAGGTGAASDGRYQGVAPGASLIGLGAGDGLHLFAVLQAWDYLLGPEVHERYNVRVTNNSYGSGPGRFDPANPINVASKRAYDKGIISVFAVGNDGRNGDATTSAISTSPCVIGVAAAQRDGRLTDFSSRGIPGDAVNRPDLTAPGHQIAAARASTGFAVTALYPNFPDGDLRYVILDGTSMASPHVAGAVALLLETNPELSFEEVLEAMTATARPMTDADGRPYAPHEVGAGYLDVLGAIAYTRGDAPPPTDGTSIPGGTSVYQRYTGSVGSAATVGGVAVRSSEDVHGFDLPSVPDLQALRVRLSWSQVAGTLDLALLTPSGSLLRAAETPSTGENGTAHKEIVLGAGAAPGRYEIRVQPRSNVNTQYEGTVFLTRP